MRNSSVWFSLLFTVSFVIACGDDSSSTDAGDETGECTPGDAQVTGDGCTGEDVRELTCNATCALEETLECGPPPGVDIIFAVHARAWWDRLPTAERPRYADRAAERLESRVVSPLLTGSMERFWDRFRGTDDLPTVGEYNTAARRSLLAVDLTEGEANAAMAAVRAQQQLHGITTDSVITHVPSPTARTVD